MADAASPTDTLKHYLPLILGLLGLLGAVSTAILFYGKLEYVAGAVNPDTIIEYRVNEAKRETIKELRWCFGKAKVQNKTLAEALNCLD